MKGGACWRNDSRELHRRVLEAVVEEEEGVAGLLFKMYFY